MKKVKKSWVLCLLLMIFVGAVLACLGEAVAQKPSEYIVGYAMPLTGPAGGYGTDFTHAFLMGVDEINKAGGIDGTPIKVVREDTLGNAEGGINAFNKLVQIKKAPVIVVAWSTVVKAMAALAEQNKTLILNTGANAPSLSGISPLEINAFPLSDIDVTASVEYAYNTLGKRSAAVLYINNSTGIGAAKLYKKHFEKLGGKVVAYESVEPDSIDVSTQVIKIRAANPDVIYMQLLHGEMAHSIKKIRQMGIKALLTTYSAGNSADVRKAARDAAHGMIYAAMMGGNDKAIKGFAAKFEKAHGHYPLGMAYCVYQYDASYLLKDAISYMNKMGWKYNGLNIKKAILKKKKFNLPLTGVMIFDEKGDIKKAVSIYRVVNWATPDKDELITTIEP